MLRGCVSLKSCAGTLATDAAGKVWRPRRDLNPCYRRESASRCCKRLKPGGMDSALPPRTAPFGHLLGRVVDARTCFRIRCIPRAAKSIARSNIRSIEAEFFLARRHLLPLFTQLDADLCHWFRGP